jgi:hypothetical protein
MSKEELVKTSQVELNEQSSLVDRKTFLSFFFIDSKYICIHSPTSFFDF